jgi:tetratricopeptide (TPR) repeat protein
MSWIWSRGLVFALAALATLATLAYGAGVVSMFAPDELPSWRENFAGHVFIWMYIPFSLWMFYMYARVTLGRRLLEQGRAEEALEWSASRVQPNIWLRTQREALVHRLVMAQALLRLGRWEQAQAMLRPPAAILPADVPELAELVWWRAELDLRREDLEAARKGLEGHTPHKRTPNDVRAALLACLAEVWLLEGNAEQARRFLQDATWRVGDAPRVALTRALYATRHASSDDERRDALDALITAHDALVRQLPARGAELWALRARLHEALGQRDEAAQAHVAASAALADNPDGRAVRLATQEGPTP